MEFGFEFGEWEKEVIFGRGEKGGCILEGLLDYIWRVCAERKSALHCCIA